MIHHLNWGPDAMAERAKKQAEVEANFKAFRKELPNIIDSHRGKFALMRDAKIIDYFDTIADVIKYATKIYPDGLYSVQEVTDNVVDLGWYSRVAIHAPV